MVAHSGEGLPKTGAEIALPMLVGVVLETEGRLETSGLYRFVADVTGTTVEDVAQARAKAEADGVLIETSRGHVVDPETEWAKDLLARDSMFETAAGRLTVSQMRGFLDRWRKIRALEQILQIDMINARHPNT